VQTGRVTPPGRARHSHPPSLIWDEEEGKRRHEQAVENRRAQAMRDMSDPG
jgi:hypothetical protein